MVPRADDVVFSYETRLGQAAIIPPGLVCCLGRRMALVRTDKNALDAQFFVYQFVSPPFRSFLASRTVLGATVDRISLKEFPSFVIKVPDLNEQIRIARHLKNAQQEIRHLSDVYARKCDAIDRLKLALLNDVFSGRMAAAR